MCHLMGRRVWPGHPFICVHVSSGCLGKSGLSETRAQLWKASDARLQSPDIFLSQWGALESFRAEVGGSYERCLGR